MQSVSSSFETFEKLDFPLFRMSTTLSVEQKVPSASWRQDVILELPPGLPSARAYTLYAVTPSLSGSGSGSWNWAASPSLQLLSRTLYVAPSARSIRQFPVSGTWITLPLAPPLPLPGP